jgi:hypothetical protein
MSIPNDELAALRDAVAWAHINGRLKLYHYVREDEYGERRVPDEFPEAVLLRALDPRLDPRHD